MIQPAEKLLSHSFINFFYCDSFLHTTGDICIWIMPSAAGNCLAELFCNMAAQQNIIFTIWQWASWSFCNHKTTSSLESREKRCRVKHPRSLTLQSCFFLFPLAALQAVQRREDASSHLALSRMGTVKKGYVCIINNYYYFCRAFVLKNHSVEFCILLLPQIFSHWLVSPLCWLDVMEQTTKKWQR